MLDRYAEQNMRLSEKESSAKRKIRSHLEPDTKGILGSWKNIAVLEGLTLSPPHNQIENLRRRLGMSETEMRTTLATLKVNKLIFEENGIWKKSEEHLYWSSGRSRQELRGMHDQVLLQRISQADFEQRLITCFTVAMSKEKMGRLKAKMIDFLDEFSREGECADVYQCSLQFFPLTRDPVKTNEPAPVDEPELLPAPGAGSPKLPRSRK